MNREAVGLAVMTTMIIALLPFLVLQEIRIKRRKKLKSINVEKRFQQGHGAANCEQCDLWPEQKP